MWRGEHRCRRKEDGVWLDAKAEIDSSGGKWEAKHDLVYGAGGVMRLAPLPHLTLSGYRYGTLVLSRWGFLGAPGLVERLQKGMEGLVKGGFLSSLAQCFYHDAV